MIPAQDALCNRCWHNYGKHCTRNDLQKQWCHDFKDDSTLCDCRGFVREYNPSVKEFYCEEDESMV